ncbi:MAG TPA: alpha/beta hydrolase [Pyrinomonadaceae bacterium]|nr:alpha/beta hydrolase [Pyrinomonadaceae bacterium]
MRLSNSAIKLNNRALKPFLFGDITIKLLLRSLIIIPLLVYVGSWAYAYFFFNRIAFQPPSPSYQDTGAIIKLVSNRERISAIYLKNPNSRYTILYSHGNAEDIGLLLPIFERLQEMGFSIFAFDYRGYGTSSGQPSEEGTYRDIDAAYEYLTLHVKVPADQIIALGRSLGGAVAIDLAKRKPLAGLVIESSFVSAFRVVTSIPLFPWDRFRSISKIKDVHCPVLVIHGTNDTVIPFWHGERLFQQANDPKLSYWVKHAGHNDLFEVAGSGYAQALKSFTAKINNNI